MSKVYRESTMVDVRDSLVNDPRKRTCYNMANNIDEALAEWKGRE